MWTLVDWARLLEGRIATGGASQAGLSMIWDPAKGGRRSGSVDKLAEVRSVVVDDNDRFNLTERKPCMGARPQAH